MLNSCIELIVTGVCSHSLLDGTGFGVHSADDLTLASQLWMTHEIRLYTRCSLHKLVLRVLAASQLR